MAHALYFCAIYGKAIIGKTLINIPNSEKMSRLFTSSFFNLLLIFFVQNLVAAEAMPSLTEAPGAIARLNKEADNLEKKDISNLPLSEKRTRSMLPPLRLEEGLDVTIESLEASTGDHICLDVTVANFQDLAALSFTMNYDKEVLEFDTVTNIAFPNVNQFTYGENFGTPAGPEPIEEGFVTMVWTSPGLQPFDFPDGRVIFQLCFTVIGSGTTTVSITGDLTPIDVIDATEQPVMLNPTPGVITLPGDGGGGGGGSTNTDKCGETYNGFTVVANDVNAEPGDQICVDVCVANFTNIAALSFTMSYDDSVLDFDTVTNIAFPNVNQFTYGETFGTPAGPEPIESGFVTMVWTSPGLQPFSYDDGTVIFQVCFTVKANTTANSTKFEFSGDLTPIDVIDNLENPIPFNSVDGTIALSGNNGGGGGGNFDKCGETYTGFTVVANDVNAEPGDQICVDVCVANFTDIAALSFTMNYDDRVLDFDTVTNIAFPNVNQFTYGETFGTPAGPEPIESGFVTMVWTSPGLQPFSYDDGTVIFQVCFTVKANTTANSTKLEFSGDLTPIDVIDANENPVAFNSVDGTIFLGDNGGGPTEDKCNQEYNGFTVVVNDATAQTGDEICLDVCVANFTNITGLSFTMTYDDDILAFDTVNNIIFPNVDRFSYAETFGTPNGAEPLPSGFVTFVWTSPGIQPWSYDDGTVIFQLCFTVIGNTSTDVELNGNLTPIDVIDANENSVPFNGVNGLVEIGVFTAPTIVQPNITGINCFGETSGAIDITVQGGTGDFSYAWNHNNSTSEDLTGLPAGQYTVTVTDNTSGLQTQQTFTVPGPTGAVRITDVNVTDVSCRGESDGSITVNATGGTGNLSYSWSAGLPAGNTQASLDAGTYRFTVTDENNCMAASTPIVVRQPSAALAIQTDVQDVRCAGESTGSIVLQVSGGTAPYDYDWSGGLQDGMDRQTALSPGQYSVTVTDENGCQIESGLLTIQEGTTNIEISSIVPTNIENGNDGRVTLTVAGNTANYTYSWEGPEGFTSSAANLTNLGLPGEYCVTVSDGNCTVEACANVTAQLQFGEVTIERSCAGESSGSIDLSVIGGVPVYSFEWSNGETTQNIAGLSRGTYTVTVTDDSGDEVNATFEVGQYAAAVVNPNVTYLSAEGASDGAINLNISGSTPPYEIEWDNGSTDLSRNNLAAGQYCATITDGNGCAQEVCIEMIVLRPFVFEVQKTDLECNGENTGEIAFTIDGGASPYTIEFADGEVMTSQDGNVTRTGLTGRQYSYTITDQRGEVLQGSTTINQPNPIEVSNIEIRHDTDEGACTGTIAIEISGGSPGYSVQWNSSNTGVSLSGLCEGMYVPTIVDANDCEVTAPAIEITTFSAGTVDITDTNCPMDATGSIDLNVRGGSEPYSFEWRNAAGDLMGDTEDLENVISGTYTVVLTEGSGNTLTRSYTVGAQSTLGLEVSVTSNYSGFEVSCQDATDGVAVAQGLNGDGSYSYEWMRGDALVGTEAVLSEAGVGIYQAIVIDGQGCEMMRTVELAAPEPISINANLRDINCPGESNGEIIVSATGGAGQGVYFYQWSNGSIGQRNAFLRSGDYTLTVSDVNQCETIQTFAIAEPDPLVLTIDTQAATEGCNGAATATVEGGTPPYNYTWDSETTITESMIDKLCHGIHFLKVTDSRGCVSGLDPTDFIVQDRRFPCIEVREVITPDGDGLNERFVINCIDDFPDNSLQIFNRWGQLVYEAEGYDCSDQGGVNCFMGETIRGEELPDGAYYYVLVFADGEGNPVQRKGSLTIVRE
jgi:gliding motility-associated-like protein